jgi:hypothetical protein
MNSSDYSTQDDTSDSDYGEDKNDIYILTTVAVELVEDYYMPYIAKEPCRTSPQTGYKWVIEIVQGTLICVNKISKCKYMYSFTCVKS